jgi:trimeric autotransporter adhesin
MKKQILLLATAMLCMQLSQAQVQISGATFTYDDLVNYGSDISANFGNLSLINKGYADARYAPYGNYVSKIITDTTIATKTFLPSGNNTAINIETAFTANGFRAIRAIAHYGYTSTESAASSANLTQFVVSSSNTANWTAPHSSSAITGSFITQSGSTGTITSVTGLRATFTSNASGANITNAYCLNTAVSNSSKVANGIGIGIEDISGSSNTNTNLLVGSLTPPSSGNWNAYFNSSKNNYFGTGNSSIGTTSPNAKLHIVSTTEQLRLGYDESNYYSTTVGFAGAATFDAVGSSASFSFGDALTVTSGDIAVAGSGNRYITSDFIGGGTTGADIDNTGKLIRTVSDARLKTNVEIITNNLEKILQLRPVKYNYINTEKYGAHKTMGFIAQEVEKIVPEAVKISNDEFKLRSLNYVELIPVLAGALQEEHKKVLQLEARVSEQPAVMNNDVHAAKITELESKLATMATLVETLRNDINACCANGTNTTNRDASTLGQNVPNPTNGTTTIGYHVSGTHAKAFISIYDLNGHELKRVALSPEATQITIEKGELRSGQYIYSLIVDQELVDSKKMVVME